MHFFIDKITNTFADVSVAFGWMRVLRELHDVQGTFSQTEIVDDGPYYRVSAAPISDDTLERLQDRPIVPGNARFIRTLKNADKIPAGISDPISYEEERQQVEQYFAAQKKAQDGQNTPDRPHIHWDIFRAINPAALPGYNNLIADWWIVRAAQPEIMRLLFDLFSVAPNDVSSAMTRWKTLDKAHGWDITSVATAQQLYNPDQGKGQNRTKADGLSDGNLDNFWLLEWLKLVGFYEAALTRLVRGTKDRKTFVVAPRAISYADHSEIMSRFNETMRYGETSTKFDVLAALRYLKTLLSYFNEEQRRPSLGQLGNVKKRLVGGFYTAFYKDLGNAVATMNVSFIALPGWVEVYTPEDVTTYDALLDELENVVRQFDESHSDAFTLLQHLRNFVSGDDLTAFFRFTNAFPAYLMGRRDRSVASLSVSFIERLIMTAQGEHKDWKRIVTNPGFRNVAYAIRQCTRRALASSSKAKKTNGERFPYEIRYGLAHDLTRAAAYEDKFVSKLSDFLIDYNNETIQVEDRMRKLDVKFPFRSQRRSVSDTDIAQILGLITEFGSEPIAKLLVACGYAKTAYVSPDDDDADEPQEENES